MYSMINNWMASLVVPEQVKLIQCEAKVGPTCFQAVRRRVGVVLLAISVSGCTSLWNPVPAGVVTGLVLYNGQPAAGKRVSLARTQKYAFTNAQGRYSFSSVPMGVALYVRYELVRDREDARPHEIEQWQSAPIQLDTGQGKEVPAIDVAYNGLLYPHESLALIVKPTSPVPFHWSTHTQAMRYRMRIVAADARTPIWTSNWDSSPTAVFAQAVAPGWYEWTVEADAGDHGTGILATERVNF